LTVQVTAERLNGLSVLREVALPPLDRVGRLWHWHADGVLEKATGLLSRVADLPAALPR
jgi:hypothetical protein